VDRLNRGSLAISALLVATILVIFIADIATERDVTFAALVVVPLAIAASALESGYRWMLALALVLILVAAGLGTISETTAATVAAGALGTVAVIRLSRRPAPGPVSVSVSGRAVRSAAAGSAFGAGVLTVREREVAALAVEGLTAREIGEQLFIGERTVETHLAHCYAKLGVGSKRELIRLLTGRP
jgi:DNA-binding CsgD family transcriptional regulator